MVQRLALIEIVMDEIGKVLEAERGLTEEGRLRLIRARANAARVDIAQRELANMIRHTQVLPHTRKIERQYAEDMPLPGGETLRAD